MSSADAASIVGILKQHAQAIVQTQSAEEQCSFEAMVLRLDKAAMPVTVGMQSTKHQKMQGKLDDLLTGSRFRGRGRRTLTPLHGGHQKTKSDAGELSRFQILVDAALCCVNAEDMAADPAGVTYLWVDSSPLRRTDWLLSTVMRVSSHDLQALVQAARTLRATCSLFHAAEQHDVDDDQLDELVEATRQRDEAGRVLHSCIKLHKQLPMALASGASSSYHKLKCVLQKFWHETMDPGVLRKVLQSLRGACTDMGAEMTMPDLVGPSMEDLLPKWIADQLALETGTDGTADHASWTSSMCMPNCLVIPGLCHIVHNLCLQAGTSLSWWKEFQSGFMPLAYMLHHRHLRERFVATCIEGTPHQDSAELFKLQCPTHQSWRWGSLQRSLKYILRRREALRSAWDPRKFLQLGSQKSTLTDNDKAGLKTNVMTASIRSPMWWSYAQMLHKFLA